MSAMTAAVLRGLRARISAPGLTHRQRVAAVAVYVDAHAKTPVPVRVWARASERGTCAQRRLRRRRITQARGTIGLGFMLLRARQVRR